MTITLVLFHGLGSASAWDGTGHETAVAVAWRKLDATTKKKLMAVFAADLRQRDIFSAATWPDDIKQNKNNGAPFTVPINPTWHYVNIPYDATAAQTNALLHPAKENVDPAHPYSANAVTAIRYYTAQLKAGFTNATAEADAVSWLIHLVGDVHQPLHCVTVVNPLPNYTPPLNSYGERDDGGGNGFRIHGSPGDLHGFWDDLLDQPAAAAGMIDNGLNEKKAALFAKQLIAQYPPTRKQLAATDPADWASESYSYRAFAYSPPLDQPVTSNQWHTVTAAYSATAVVDAEQRIVLAGERLARVLKSIYGKK